MTDTNMESVLLARLAAMSFEDAATFAKNPGSTIVPAEGAADSRRGRAQALLGELGVRRSDSLRIERTLGEGGMGIVHLAEQTSMGRRVAVKTLKAEHRDPTSSMRLVREAWITGALEHPNIMPVYDVAVDASGTPQVVLKRIEGVDWATLLASPDQLRGRADGDAEEWNLRTLVEVCNALHFAHDRGVIHRDLKPENVMIGAFGEVYVVDWGIAVSLREDENPRLPRVTEATGLAGTPLYMAPEMVRGDTSLLSVRTDVYLLGSVLFELITGRPPHEGPTLLSIFAQALSSPPEIPKTVPGEIADICRRAMARDPADRYASVTEFRRAVVEYLEHRGSMRLARNAEQRLTDLLNAIRDPGEVRASDAAVHHLFGECRFGFRAALDAWEGNVEAREGLRRAITAMAEREVAAGNVAAARVLVGELGDAAGELRAKLAGVEQALVVDAQRREQLEVLERDQDPAIGSRTRFVMSIAFGITWTVLPILAQLVFNAVGLKPSPRYALMIAFVMLPLALGVGYWARDSLSKTAINRHIYSLLLLTLVAQIVLASALMLMGVESVESVALNFFLGFTVVGAGAITVDARLWPTAAGYALALYAGVLWPNALLYLMGGSHLVLTANVAAIWGPLAYRRRAPA